MNHYKYLFMDTLHSSKCGKPYYFYKDDGAEWLYLDATYMVHMQKMRQST